MKYCINCVTPETAETNTFDENGLCSVCKQIQTKMNINWKDRYNSLINIVEEHKGKYEYDCIIPFSGGKDSTFTLCI